MPWSGLWSFPPGCVRQATSALAAGGRGSGLTGVSWAQSRVQLQLRPSMATSSILKLRGEYGG